MDDKSETRTISMPKSLWAAVDAHAPEVGEDRSSYFRRIAQNDLRAAGKLPGTDEAEARAQLVAAGEEMGFSNALAALRKATRKGDICVTVSEDFAKSIGRREAA